MQSTMKSFSFIGFLMFNFFKVHHHAVGNPCPDICTMIAAPGTVRIIKLPKLMIRLQHLLHVVGYLMNQFPGNLMIAVIQQTAFNEVIPLDPYRTVPVSTRVVVRVSSG